MGTHLIDGEFQSDKYPTTPRGKVPLSVKDPSAQDLLWSYAQRRREVDAEFSDDLEKALRLAGYAPRTVKSRLEGRPGFKTEEPETNALARDLGQLAKKHGLLGVVLISFTRDHVGVNSSSETRLFGDAMVELGDRVLAAIDDGQFDPSPILLASRLT